MNLSHSIKCGFCGGSGMIITDEGDSESCIICEGGGKIDSDPMIAGILDLLWEIFDKDAEKIELWLNTPLKCWNDISPLLMIHLNREQAVYELLKNEVDDVPYEMGSS